MRRWFGMPAVISAVAALIAISAIHWRLTAARAALDEQTRFLKGEIARLDREFPQYDALHDAIQSLLARKQIIEFIERERRPSAAILQECAHRLTAGTRLVSLRLVRSTVYVTALAVGDREMNAFVASIAASPYFEPPKRLEIADQPRTRGGPYRLRYSFEVALRAASPGERK